MALVVAGALAALAGCHEPGKPSSHALAVPPVQGAAAERLAREAAPFGDALVRYLAGQPREEGDAFVLRVAFEPGGFAPRMDSLADVEALLVVLRDFPGVSVTIEGHTDSEGDPDKNRRLSHSRADWVRRFLIERGIASKRVEAQGFGDSQPIADNSTAEGQQQNRRLVVRVHRNQ